MAAAALAVPALEHRVASVRAMLSVLLEGLGAQPGLCCHPRVGVPSSRPAGEHSWGTRFFTLRELGFCGKVAAADGQMSPGHPCGPRLGPRSGPSCRGHGATTWLL